MEQGKRPGSALLGRILADAGIVTASLGLLVLAQFLLVLWQQAGEAPRIVAGHLGYFLQLWPALVVLVPLATALAGWAFRRHSRPPPHPRLASPGAYSSDRSAWWNGYLLVLAGWLGARHGKSRRRKGLQEKHSELSAEMQAPKVLVVGGAGYIGSVLVRDLLAEGYAVRVLDSLLYGEEPLGPLLGHPRFELIRGDFRHVEPVVRAARGVEAVVHLGAIVGDSACAVDEDETLETNLAATRLLADVCRGSGVGRILFASTCSVYGACEQPVEERSAVKPVSLYAATKIDSERVLLAARERYCHPVVFRLGTAFGWSPRPRFDLVVNRLAVQAELDKKIRICNPEQWRPFLHVSDISTAFRLALAAPAEALSGEVFNVGSNAMNFTLGQLADEVAAQTPGLAVEYVSNADSRNYQVCFNKIHDRLGLDCRVPLSQGIAEVQQALRGGLVQDYRELRYSNAQWSALRLRKTEAVWRLEIPLTALQFAKNSRWWRAYAAGLMADPPERVEAPLGRWH